MKRSAHAAENSERAPFLVAMIGASRAWLRPRSKPYDEAPREPRAIDDDRLSETINV